MVNGLYTASRGMTNILAKQDVHAQNLANTSTNGFKMARLVNRTDVSIGRNDDGELRQKEMQNLSEVYTSFTQGPMVRTGNTYDLALSSSGFFSVEAADGSTRYTRNGGMSINSYGDLVTLSGNRVLDQSNNPVNIKGDSVQFQQDGGIFVDGKKEGTLGIVDFADTKKLQYGQDGLFGNTDPAGNPPTAAKTSSLMQGFLEGSNSDPVTTMVNMITDYRNYEADQKALKAVDDTLHQAVTEVGRV